MLYAEIRCQDCGKSLSRGLCQLKDLLKVARHACAESQPKAANGGEPRAD